MDLTTYCLLTGALTGAALLVLRMLPLPKKALTAKAFNNPMLASLIACAVVVLSLAFLVPPRLAAQARFVSVEDSAHDELMADEGMSGEETLLVAGKAACKIARQATGPAVAASPYRPLQRKTSAVALLLEILGAAVVSALVVSTVKPSIPPPAP